MDRIHDRQPLVLEPDQWEHWLDPDEKDPGYVQGVLEFAEPGRFEAHPVEPRRRRHRATTALPSSSPSRRPSSRASSTR